MNLCRTVHGLRTVYRVATTSDCCIRATEGARTVVYGTAIATDCSLTGCTALEITCRTSATYATGITDLACIDHACVAVSERMLRMSRCIFSTTYTVMQLMITMVDMMSRTERAPVVVMMVSIAVTPIPVICPAVMVVPPTRIIVPVVRAMPCVPT